MELVRRIHNAKRFPNPTKSSVLDCTLVGACHHRDKEKKGRPGGGLKRRSRMSGIHTKRNLRRVKKRGKGGGGGRGEKKKMESKSERQEAAPAGTARSAQQKRNRKREGGLGVERKEALPVWERKGGVEVLWSGPVISLAILEWAWIDPRQAQLTLAPPRLAVRYIICPVQWHQL